MFEKCLLVKIIQIKKYKNYKNNSITCFNENQIEFCSKPISDSMLHLKKDIGSRLQ